MSLEFAYLLKVNVAFVLLYAFYRLFFYKDTFFKLRRTILLVFFGFSLLYPLLNIQDWIKEQEPMVEVIQIYSSILPEITANQSALQEQSWKVLISHAFLYTYWGGMLFLVIRFFMQLGSILLLVRKSRRVLIQGIPVRLLSKPSGPFSFFKWIFIHPASHTEKEFDEILAHECTHVFQWHSIDVVLSELMCMVNWINPFVWLLKREVRHNLEYLADDTVLESGYDSKSYQYHLLGLAHHDRSTATIYNSFNVLHIKNRICMMNRKRSRGIGRTKYLVFIPLSACLLLLSNIDAVARITIQFASDKANDMASLTKGAASVQEAEEVANRQPVFTAYKNEIKELVSGLAEAKTTVSEEKLTITPVKKSSTDTFASNNQKEEMIFTVVEQMPEFPGGQTSLLQFINKNLKYPEEAFNAGIEGRVACVFIVNTDGSICNAEVLRGVSPSLDSEALRVIRSMPKWTPGYQRGKAVRVKFNIPITFRLN